MDRRTFLSSLAASLALTRVEQPAHASPRVLRLDLQQVPLAGFQYHAGGHLWSRLAVGQDLSLVREPENRYDQNAVRVDWNGVKLGYVPRADNAALATLMDQRVVALAAVARLQESHNPWDRILMDLRIAITL